MAELPDREAVARVRRDVELDERRIAAPGKLVARRRLGARAPWW